MRAGLIALPTSLLLVAAPAAAQGAPVDSVLAAACQGGGSLADGLLSVTFRPAFPADRQAAAAREVGGALAPGSSGLYLILPPDRVLDAVADRLIGVDGVVSVGGVACPPPSPPPVTDTAVTDSTRRPAADSTRPPAATDTTPPTDSTPAR